jgi:hypothetical protein
VKLVYGQVHTIAAYDPMQKVGYPYGGEYDLLLVAFPFGEDFIEQVRTYQRDLHVKATLVFSTTAIGTCSQLGAVHCPIEGRHPDLAESIGATSRWLGGHDPLVEQFFDEAHTLYRVLPKPEHTEALKLMSTTNYGVAIEYARYCKSVCDDIGMDYENVKEWTRWYNALYAGHFGMDWAKRPVLDPPVGAIGGHCVVPNARILQKQYPDALVGVVAGEDGPCPCCSEPGTPARPNLESSEWVCDCSCHPWED